VKPAPFEYHAPETTADAVGLLAEHGDEAKPLAGGQSLVPMLALRLTRFGHLVDLNRIPELNGIKRSNGTVVVGAMTRQVALESSDAAAAVPLLTKATPFIGHFQIRNRGTVGGSIAHADPAAELPAVALALDAELEVASTGGTRRVPASEFFQGTWTTSVEDGELLTSVRFPVWSDRAGFAVDEVARRMGDFALVGVTCGVELDGSGTVTRAAIALLGMGATPLRAAAAEAALVGAAPSATDLTEIGQLAVADLDPPEDIHASSLYRRSVGAHVVARAIGAALEDAGRA
jgi:carbon-monoxide dehydrogenase medium subunit